MGKDKTLNHGYGRKSKLGRQNSGEKRNRQKTASRRLAPTNGSGNSLKWVRKEGDP